MAFVGQPTEQIPSFGAIESFSAELLKLPDERANKASTLLNHDLGRLDDSLHRVALFEAHRLGASASDHAFDDVAAHIHRDVRHDFVCSNLFNRAGQLISRGKSHTGDTTRDMPVLPE